MNYLLYGLKGLHNKIILITGNIANVIFPIIKLIKINAE